MRNKIIILLIVLGGVSAWYFLYNKPVEAPAFKSEALVKTQLSAVISATGTVEPNNRLAINPQVSGRLESVLVKEGDTVKKGAVLAWVSSTDRAALLDAARMQGKDAIAYWENVYKPTPLIAPIAGTVIVQTLEPGQSVGTDTAVVVIADNLIVKAQVDETDIGRVHVGQQVEISLDAYPEEIITGKVVHIAYESTVVSNVTIYEVKIAPTSMSSKLRSGMGANVSIIEKQATVLALPVDAVSSNAKGDFVLIPGEDHPQRQKVKLGMTDEKMVEIVSGLSPTATVLVKNVALSVNKKKKSSSPFMPSRRPQQH